MELTQRWYLKKIYSQPVYSKNIWKSKKYLMVKKLQDSNHTSLAVINLESTLKQDKNYYQQVLLKECKYIEKND